MLWSAGRRGPWLGRVIPVLLTCCLVPTYSQIRYSVPEELDHGAFVGNIAEDLGLDISKLSPRRFRIVSGTNKQHLEVNLENGILFVNEKIDREEVCEFQPVCFLHLQVVMENPLELYRVEVEILDINDNAPSFPWHDYVLEVTESAAPGSRFPLESAQDPDVGSNSLRTYKLSPNGFFSLEIQSRSDGSKFAELVLERPLDREQQKTHRVLLTALDGGIPERSGTALVTISVLDANDNVPTFDQSFYRVSLPENVSKGTLVIKLNATDLDEGTNGEIEYSFSGHAPQKVRDLFMVEPRSGQVRVKGILDYEKANLYELYVQAKDRGPSAVAVHCRVLVNLLDVNDNAPEVILTSVSTPVMEDAPPGTVIAVISVMDRDSGDNGDVSCDIPKNVPFQLHSSYKNYYTLVTTEVLDREVMSEYNITISARDFGSPPLMTKKIINVQVTDINDNIPTFVQPSYTVYVTENNPPGASICSVTALDPDCNQNAYLSYSIMDGQIQGMPVSTYVSINSDSGNIYALRSFDFEQIRNFQIRIQAQDAGFPPLSSNVTVNVFILDQNDNAPVIVYPLPKNGTVATDVIPRNADPGYLVGKISAMDADSGQNSRLSYQILQATDSTLFSVALYTGELRTMRALGDKDATRHRLLIQVRDNGQPSLSTSVSIVLTVVDSMPETLSELNDVPLNSDPDATSSLTLYLIVSLGSVSFTFLVAIIVLTAIKCHKDRPSLQDYKCSIPTCCCLRSGSPGGVFKNSNINLQISSGNKVQTNCMESSGSASQNYCYKVCLTPESAKSDFMFLKPYNSTTQNNEKIPEKVAPGGEGKNQVAVNNAVNEIKLPNTDWSPQKTQKPGLKSSQSLEDLGTRKGVKKDHDRLRTLVSPVTDVKKTTPTSNGVWSPKYGLPFQQHIPSLDYQHNVYIPGTPTLLANKQGLYIEHEEKNSFSTFGKKRKMTSCCDVHDDMIINNDLK
ncbi:protocadherin-10-like isoform X1 [Spea bombifrons]|uniref:protocadherin-10-like isoform X1 n=1 Tax=Spea bombifrons TaxID=233779 RepID=UPI00234BD84D|nr:protocadherin-10-like isoform X1 [Spea bombifrons]